jgi:hypothetical protein
MIVHRVTAQYQVGKAKEAMALIKEEIARAKFPHAVRLYLPRFGVADMTISEYEFENLDEMAQFWADWEAQPEAQSFSQKYQSLILPGMLHEIFDLIPEIDKQ